MSRTYAAFTLLIAIAAADAAAPLDRRSRDEPEMFVEAGGRTGTCDAFTFSPDGKFLYAAGDDKVIRAWEVGRDGLDVGGMKTFRWPVWREQRGGVKALALHPTDGSLVVGGYGLKNSLVVQIGPDGEIRATNEAEKMHAQNVLAAAFVPDGKAVIYGTADGKLWHWDLANAPVDLSPGNPGTKIIRPRLIRFLGPNAFLAVLQNGEVHNGTRAGGNWTVSKVFSALDVFQGVVRVKPPAGGYEVFRADVSADGGVARAARSNPNTCCCVRSRA